MSRNGTVSGLSAEEVVSQTEKQGEYQGADGTWVYVRGISAKLGADIDALHAAGNKIKSTDALLQDTISRFDNAESQLIEDWSYLCADARRHAERSAELSGTAVVQRPTWEEERQYSTQLAEIETLRRRAIELAPGLRELVVGVFTASFEYERAEAEVKKKAEATQWMYLNPFAWGPVMCQELFNKIAAATPEQHIGELLQLGPLLGIDKVRELFARGTVTVAGAIQRYIENDEAPTYSAAVEDLAATRIATQNVSGINSAIESFRDAKAENNSAIQITKAVKDGKPMYTVSVPGTVSWDPSGWEHPIDLTSNLETMYGLQSTGMAYVEAAMERAGIEDGAEVVMLGHSQGGLIASGLAAKTAFTDKYQVKGLVTMNSPTAHNPVKKGIPTLHLENQNDPVTMLENKQIPVTADRWQVVGRVDQSDGIGNHDVETSRRVFEAAINTVPEVRDIAGRIEQAMPSTHEVVETYSYDIKHLDPTDQK